MTPVDFLLGALSLNNLLLSLLGVAAGIVIGALPGLTATMAVAVLVPFTFGMNAASGLIMLGAIYMGAIYGGSYSAILLNTPGTPSAIATTFEGYPMAKRGDGDLALTLACLVSVFGGLFGAFALLLIAPPMAQFALRFGPVEYFWFAVFGLTLIASLGEESMLKSLIGCCLGLLLAMIGLAEVGGDVRFTGGTSLLLGGIDIVAALIGLYCVPVLIDLVATPKPHLETSKHGAGFRLHDAMGVILRGKFNLMRSSVIGTIVGILPGAGGSIAAIVAYAEAKRGAKDADGWGHGNPQGIVATESANNATVGGGLIPTLVLGIPGTPVDAVILGALLVQGIRVGPSLFSEQSSVSYVFMYGLIIATLIMLPVGLLLGRYAFKLIISIPKEVLTPAVAFMTILGSFAINNDANNVVQMVLLGGIGWVLGRFGFSVTPVVLGIILESIAESGFVQAYIIGGARGSLLGEFVGNPISMVIIGLIVLSVVYAMIRGRKRGSVGE